MELTTEQKTYARLLLHHAVSLRPGQDLYIRGTDEVHDFAIQVGDMSYEIGPRGVHYRFIDRDQLAQLIRRGTPHQIALFHEKDRVYYSDIIRTGSALLNLASHFELDPEIRRAALENPANYRRYIDERQEVMTHISRRALHEVYPRSLAPCATTRWAKNLFPELGENDAENRLWSLITQAAGADQPDALETFPARAAQLEARSIILNDLRIRQLHVTGAGNDLTLGLPATARWQGGYQKTIAGQTFYPNFPSEEIFTTPDRRTTEGRLVVCKPLRLFNGSVVKNLVLEFNRGRIVDFSASEGREEFSKWIEIDEGARHLGEIGLVAEDSRIAQTGAWFDFNNLDENAAAHVALGQSIELLMGSDDALSDAQLEALGCNRSAIHTDLLFGNPDVTIRATRTDLGEVVLIENGRWTAEIAAASPAEQELLAQAA